MLNTGSASAPDNPLADLSQRYHAIRQFSLLLCKPLSAEDTTAQSMPEASPAKWHLAHTTWFFETFILEKYISNYRPYHADYRVLFNSYYNSVGEQYLRAQRGMITRPGLQEIMAYRAYVDGLMQELLQRDPVAAVLQLIELGLQHEQQHQELMLTDIKHLFSLNPLYPVYRSTPILAQAISSPPLTWRYFSEGVHWIGHGGAHFAFDNETPRHRVFIHAFELATRPVNNGEYLAFIEDGGYRRAEFWLSDAWQLLQSEQWSAPLYWQQREAGWYYYTLSGLRMLNANEPVTHVSYYEADAYARWAGARLPTEQEWEYVAQGQLLSGNFVESGVYHPLPPGAPDSNGFMQLFGDVWEWTASAYTAYPGYRAPAGELAEYNGKFMCNQMVLRGGSCVSSQTHLRASYRNFFMPQAKWQFSGLRLVRDVD